MMHSDHETFVQAVKSRKKIILTYFSGEHNLYLTRLCVPLDYCACYTPVDSKGFSEFYYFWDEETDLGKRMLDLPTSQIKFMELSNDTFNPADYITPHNNRAY